MKMANSYSRLCGSSLKDSASADRMSRGGWIWNLQGTRRVPYRLPELMKSVAAGQTIYKGEKDVDNLRDIGQALSTRCRIGDRLREGFGETDVKSQPKQIVSELSSVQ